jgi:hypothetical protein
MSGLVVGHTPGFNSLLTTKIADSADPPFASARDRQVFNDRFQARSQIAGCVALRGHSLEDSEDIGNISRIAFVKENCGAALYGTP